MYLLNNNKKKHISGKEMSMRVLSIKFVQQRWEMFKLNLLAY